MERLLIRRIRGLWEIAEAAAQRLLLLGFGFWDSAIGDMGFRRR